MNVTYLLGAGASANALPTYENFNYRFRLFSNFIRSKIPEVGQIINKSRLKDISESIDSFEQEFTFHNTPDLIAKKYFHKYDIGRLQSIKDLIILFFLHEQGSNEKVYSEIDDSILKDVIDKRYDAFIASLLKPIPQKIELLNNFSILSWNYDLQVEISFSSYIGETIPSIQKHIQSYPKILSENSAFDKDKFSIIHLNGIAYARPDKNAMHYDNLGLFVPKDQHYASYIEEVYEAMHTTPTIQEIGGSKLLSFAWENINEDYSLKENEILKNALSVAEKTEILVIIGYSFPIFNRVIDKIIFDKMNQLRTVYIQSPQSKNIQNILDTDLIKKTDDYLEVDYQDVGYWNQFYIPSEWNNSTPYKGPSII